MNIISLQVENVKRIKALKITPDGNLVVIGGKNDQGKSSCIDSIAYAIGGADALPEMPVRKGEDRASIVVELDDLIVKRTFTSTGGTALTVTNKQGLKYGSPQAVLDALVGKLSFDPLAFIRMKPAQQSETLRALVGIDFMPFNAQIKKIYDERTGVNRESVNLEQRIAALPMPVAGTPDEETPAGAILDEQSKASAINAKNDRQRRAAKDGERGLSDAKEDHAAELKAIQKLKAELQQRQVACDAAAKSIADSEKATAAATKTAADLKDEDLSVFAGKLTALESTNRKVRDAKARKELSEQLKAKKTASETLTASIAKIETDKANAIKNAKFPIDGLAVNDVGDVVFNGIPFSQASTAQQTKTSVAIGFALNPKLKILLIREGSLLDTDSLAEVAEQAKSAGGQIWMERVSTGGEVSVIIEDGMAQPQAEASK